MKATWRTTADEPASAALRRLHEEATPGPWTIVQRPGVTIEAVLDGLPREVVSISGQAAGFDLRAEPPEIMAANGRAVATLRNAADALADLVTWAEDRASESCHWQPMHEPGEKPDTCVACGARRALAALRERLEAK